MDEPGGVRAGGDGGEHPLARADDGDERRQKRRSEQDKADRAQLRERLEVEVVDVEQLALALAGRSPVLRVRAGAAPKQRMRVPLVERDVPLTQPAVAREREQPRVQVRAPGGSSTVDGAPHVGDEAGRPARRDDPCSENGDEGRAESDGVATPHLFGEPQSALGQVVGEHQRRRRERGQGELPGEPVPRRRRLGHGEAGEPQRLHAVREPEGACGRNGQHEQRRDQREPPTRDGDRGNEPGCESDPGAAAEGVVESRHEQR